MKLLGISGSLRGVSTNSALLRALAENAPAGVTLEVYGLIGELPMQRDRELLWRYYVLGHDKEQLCRDFSLGVEHFDRVLHRARSRLRELVEKNHAAL